MTTKLTLYNGALLEIGERALSSTSEERESRRLLDQIWDTGVIDYCLGLGQWKFAKRTVEMTADPGVALAFGYEFGYTMPDDHVRTTALCTDEYLSIPLLRYSIENGKLFTDDEPIYLSYVSNGASYGADLTIWPPDFVRLVELYLASRIVWKLSQNKESLARIEKALDRATKEAKNQDAMEGPTVFPPDGALVSARRGRSSSVRNSRSSLMG